MAKLTFPASPNGLAVTVVVGLDGAMTANLYASGMPIPAPVELPGEVDCGSTVTAVAPWILRRLGLTRGIPATTQTMGGLVSVNLFSVSLTIRDPQQPAAPEFTLPTTWVQDMAEPLPDVHVLVGLNVLLECDFLLEGPLRRFSFEF
jgi:hypothetical protein